MERRIFKKQRATRGKREDTSIMAQSANAGRNAGRYRATAPSVVEDEINDILAPLEQFAERGDERARAKPPMKPQLAVGDRVKLNERGMRLMARHSWTKVDWHNRRGTVRNITKRNEAHVLWDGRKSVDVQALVILERCSSPSSEDV